MASEGKMADDKQANDCTDHHDDDNACSDAQLVHIKQYQRANQSTSCSCFPQFSKLPWELRRLVWKFALPRSVFTSAVLSSEDCVPYPPMSRACREARLVVQDSGSMVTAWDKINFESCWDIPRHLEYLKRVNIPWQEDLPTAAEMCIRTWFSSKLDTLVLNLNERKIINSWEDNVQRDFIDFIGIGLSSTTCLMVYNDLAFCDSEALEDLYNNYLKHRQEILLGIGDFHLIFKDRAWDIAADLNVSRLAGNRTQVIRLGDTAALTRCVKLWEQCCHFETPRSYMNRRYDFGKWLEMASDENKRAETSGWMRTYLAWVVEAEAIEERRVSPEAYFLLRTADSIVSGQQSIHDTVRGRMNRGHEIMDDTGRLKKDHPLVRELDIKLPEVIPVCTVSFHGQCCCESGTAQPGRILCD